MKQRGDTPALQTRKIQTVSEQLHGTDERQHVAPLHTAQPPYNLFERGVKKDVLPYCLTHGVSTLTYGSLCRGLLSGKMKPDSEFHGDDVRKMDPKFQRPRYA
jgi:aryl-alcohol dehydrogenase-like predicted oxidoreductase